MEALYRQSIPVLKEKAPALSGWQRDAVMGYILLRDGVDYVNTRNRYTRARPHLDRALDGLVGNSDENKVDRARLYFWSGVARNERILNDDHIERNAEAIEFYKKGIRELAGIRGIAADRVRASLFNSMGVALHHKAKTYIPSVAQQYYTRSLKIAEDNARDPAFRSIAQRVMINSGRIWKRREGRNLKKLGGCINTCGGNIL